MDPESIRPVVMMDSGFVNFIRTPAMTEALTRLH